MTEHETETGTRATWNLGGARPSALDDSQIGAPLESWIERERRLTAERTAQLAAVAAERERQFERRLSRLRAVNCDDGRGGCLFCGVELGRDDDGAPLHVDNKCPGPPRSCAECGVPWEYDARVGRWNPACSQETHDARWRAETWRTAVARGGDPLAPPVRVYRDDEDD